MSVIAIAVATAATEAIANGFVAFVVGVTRVLVRSDAVGGKATGAGFCSPSPETCTPGAGFCGPDTGFCSTGTGFCGPGAGFCSTAAGGKLCGTETCTTGAGGKSC